MTCAVLGHGFALPQWVLRERKFEADLKAEAYCSRPERVGPQALPTVNNLD